VVDENYKGKAYYEDVTCAIKYEKEKVCKTTTMKKAIPLTNYHINQGCG
jgi:hypothetical protein